GVDRIWYVNNEVGNIDSVILFHDNYATDGVNYTDNIGYITYYNPLNSQWQELNEIHYINAGIHGSNNLISEELFLTKTSGDIDNLPVTLLSFTGNKIADKSALQWTTINEKNNKGFDIEYSTDGRLWQTIGFVASLAVNGHSEATKLHYNFTHNKPQPQDNFYRLK